MSTTPVPATLELVGEDCWPVTIRGACAVNFDVDADGYDAGRAELALSMAVATLRALTGYSVGGCPVTVRPSRRGCGEDPTWRTYGVMPGPAYRPALSSGTWINVVCGWHSSGDCGCGQVGELVLPGPVGRVDAVLLDGQEFSEWYAIGPRLVRTDGGAWPVSQDARAALSEPGSFGVRYLPAAPVDALGAAAAGALACEWFKALDGQPCALPSNTTQVARQGVTINRVNEVFPDGVTGVRVADVFVRRHNPHKLATASTVWSPDTTGR